MKLSPLLVAGLLIGGTAQASAPDLNSPEGLHHWITYYYLKPEPARFGDAVRSMAGSGVLENEDAMPPAFGFIAGVVRNNPGKLQGWVKEFETLNDNQLTTVALGIWYAQLPESQTVVYSLIKRRAGVKERLSFLLTGAPMQITSIPLEQGPWVLDANWGNFMATGSREPVLRIISTLPWIDVRGDTNRLLVGGAARWSLTSNAAQHKTVLAICEREISQQPTEVAALLKEVVANAKKELEKMSPR
jgi:hypothetical protein